MTDDLAKMFSEAEDPFLMGFEEIPKTREELDSYLRFYFGVYLASKPIEDGNSSPLDFAWDIISSMMGYKKNPKLEDFNFLGIACRSGQKSLSCGIIEAFALKHDRWRDYFHMASIFDQSKVTYGYVQDILNKKYVDAVAVKTVMSETISKSGRKLKVGTGTIRAVNSFHGSVIQDEVDLTDKKVFIESKGMLSPGVGNRSPLNVCISTRKFAFGNIQGLLKKKERDSDYPLRVHRWGVLEITEKCSDKKSGELNSELYVDEERLVALNQFEYERLTEKAKLEYMHYPAYENCYKCGIFSFCLRRLKNQIEDNPYLQPIDDIRRLFFTDDNEFFKSQRLNRKPSKSGLVYPDFESSIHLASYEKIYEIFLKEEYTGEVDLELEDMIELFKKHKCKVFVGLDFGFNVSVALLGVVDGRDNIYILAELVCNFKSDAEFAYETNMKWGHLGVDRVFPDIEDPGAIKEFKRYFQVVDADVQPYSRISKDVKWGIGLVRKHMRVPGTNRETKLWVHVSCELVTDEVIIYRRKIDPELDEPSDQIRKKEDHAMDTLRYLIVGILGMYRVGYILIENEKPVSKKIYSGENPNNIVPSVDEVVSAAGGIMGEVGLDSGKIVGKRAKFTLT